MNEHILRTECRDAPGLVAAVTGACQASGFNILSNREHVDRSRGHFFMRTVMAGEGDREALETTVRAQLPAGAEVSWVRSRPLRVVILVTREAHCLGDLLIRAFEGEMPIEIAGVVGNRDSLRPLVERFELPFVHVDHEGLAREEHERRLAEAVAALTPEFLVLAKYMRILSPSFVARYPQRMLNIHHSFLPSFVGARPYDQAFERGVKLIGATCHYVTEELDEGPIIEQEVIRVSHTDTPADLRRKGRMCEREALGRGLRLHLEGRIFIHGNKTVVFSD